MLVLICSQQLVEQFEMQFGQQLLNQGFETDTELQWGQISSGRSRFQATCASFHLNSI